MPAAVSSGQPDKNAGGCFVRLAGQDCRRLFRSGRSIVVLVDAREWAMRLALRHFP
jgi:hypothetical protein